MHMGVSGPQPQKAKFLEELAKALAFLAFFYTLSAEKQARLQEFITKMEAEQ